MKNTISGFLKFVFGSLYFSIIDPIFFVRQPGVVVQGTECFGDGYISKTHFIEGKKTFRFRRE